MERWVDSREGERGERECQGVREREVQTDRGTDRQRERAVTEKGGMERERERERHGCVQREGEGQGEMESENNGFRERQENAKSVAPQTTAWHLWAGCES
ncbi:unnamed protein product [Boreogadus saida]